LLFFFSWGKVFPPLFCFVQVRGVECGPWIGFSSDYIHLSKFFFSMLIFLFFIFCFFLILGCFFVFLVFFFLIYNYFFLNMVFFGWNKIFIQQKIKNNLMFFIAYFAHSFLCLYVFHWP
jgi:hypothetical protein